MVFPTWMVITPLLVSFLWLYWQQGIVGRSSRSRTRLFLMTFCVIAAGFDIFWSQDTAWLSTVLFVVSLVCLGGTIHLYRRMPPQLPPEPKF